MIGKKHWVIAEGYLPEPGPVPDDPALRSHETACILNAGPVEAVIELTLYFADREPAGPYEVRVPARRTLHLSWYLKLGCTCSAGTNHNIQKRT